MTSGLHATAMTGEVIFDDVAVRLWTGLGWGLKEKRLDVARLFVAVASGYPLLAPFIQRPQPCHLPSGSVRVLVALGWSPDR